jgi:hypothetical protein
MKPFPDLPELRIVRTQDLRPHEQVDEGRADPLVRSLQVDGILKNPAVVMPFADREGYIVLDGANRTVALQRLDVPHTLVQVVQAHDGSTQVGSWSHVLMGASADQVLGVLRQANGLELHPSDRERARLHLDLTGALAVLITSDERVTEVIGGNSSLPDRVRALNQLVEAYQPMCRIERTSAAQATGLHELYPEFSCLVVFPRFPIEDVLAVVSQGMLFPTGVTRFAIAPRALRVNYPLEKLASSVSLEEKQRELMEWVRARVQGRRVRYYAESTVLFDE